MPRRNMWQIAFVISIAADRAGAGRDGSVKFGNNQVKLWTEWQAGEIS